MAKPNPFVDHLLDLLEPLGAVRARAMFGGYGIYLDGLMFGLVADNVLYLKTDAENRPRFREAGLGPFVYEGASKPMEMSYCQAPAAGLDDGDVLCDWARTAVEAARRAPAKKPRAAQSL